jgi:cell division septal protein FtsQ
MSLFSKKNKVSQKSWQRKSARLHPAMPKRDGAKKKRKFSRFLFWLLFTSFLGICAYLLLFSPFLDIDSITVEGNQNVPSSEIGSIVEGVLNQKWMGVFPQRNFFLVRKKNIYDAFQKDFDKLEVVSVEKSFPGGLKVKVAERKAELVWCSGGVCYFVDSNGLAYSSTGETEIFFREQRKLTVVDDSAIPIETKKTRLNSEFVKFIEDTDSMLREDLKIDIVDSYHTPGAASEELAVRTGEGWILKISSEYTIEDAKRIIQTLFEKDLNEEAKKNLEYLDLRVKNKVYYKLR